MKKGKTMLENMYRNMTFEELARETMRSDYLTSLTYSDAKYDLSDGLDFC